MTLKLLLADDHRIVRDGLRAILQSEPGFELAGEAADGVEAVRLAERLHPDVAILDLMMPGLNGLEVTRRVVKQSPRTRVVVLSMHAEQAYVVEALRAGASAYVLKEASAEELVRAIRAAAQGERYLSAPFSEDMLGDYARRTEQKPLDPFEKLTFREREVLQLTAEGHTGAEISERLFISPRTVESHRANLMRKLSVRNQKELIRYAVRRGILPHQPNADE